MDMTTPVEILLKRAGLDLEFDYEVHQVPLNILANPYAKDGLLYLLYPWITYDDRIEGLRKDLKNVVWELPESKLRVLRGFLSKEFDLKLGNTALVGKPDERRSYWEERFTNFFPNLE